MALQMAFTNDNTSYATAYFRIVRIELDIEARSVLLVVKVWCTDTDRQAGRRQVDIRYYVFRGPDLAYFTGARNVLAGGYDALHSLPEFAGAIDV